MAREVIREDALDICVQGMQTTYVDRVHPMISYLHRLCSNSRQSHLHLEYRDQLIGKYVSDQELVDRFMQHYICHAVERQVASTNLTYEEEIFEKMRMLALKFTPKIQRTIIQYLDVLTYEQLKASHFFGIISKQCIVCYKAYCGGRPSMCSFTEDFCITCGFDKSKHTDPLTCKNVVEETETMGEDLPVCMICFDRHDRPGGINHQVSDEYTEYTHPNCPLSKRLKLVVLKHYRKKYGLTQIESCLPCDNPDFVHPTKSFNTFMREMTTSELSYYQQINEVHKDCLQFDVNLSKLNTSWFIGKPLMLETKNSD